MSRRRQMEENTADLVIFETISNLVDDDEWREIFVRMAKGDFLEGYRVGKSKLMYQRNTPDTKSMILNPQDPVETLAQCQKFMRKHSAIQTSMELEVLAKSLETKNAKGWGAVKGKGLQEHYLQEFVDAITYQSGLTKDAEDSLRRSIFVAHWKQELKKEIVFKDGAIQEIGFFALKRADQPLSRTAVKSDMG